MTNRRRTDREDPTVPDGVAARAGQFEDQAITEETAPMVEQETADVATDTVVTAAPRDPAEELGFDGPAHAPAFLAADATPVHEALEHAARSIEETTRKLEEEAALEGLDNAVRASQPPPPRATAGRATMPPPIPPEPEARPRSPGATGQREAPASKHPTGATWKRAPLPTRHSQSSGQNLPSVPLAKLNLVRMPATAASAKPGEPGPKPPPPKPPPAEPLVTKPLLPPAAAAAESNRGAEPHVATASSPTRDDVSSADIVLQALKPAEALPPSNAPRPRGPTGPLPPVSRSAVSTELPTAITAARRSPWPWLLVGFAIVIPASIVAGLWLTRDRSGGAIVDIVTPAGTRPHATPPTKVAARLPAPSPAPAAPRDVATPDAASVAKIATDAAPAKEAPDAAAPGTIASGPDAAAPAPAKQPPAPASVDPSLAAQLPRAPSLVRRGDFRAAHAIYAAVLAQNPEDPLALAGYARSGVELGSAEALSRLGERASLPSHRRLRQLLGVRLQIVQRDWQAAEKAWRALPPGLRRQPAARLLQAQLRRGAGQIEAARAVYQQLVEQDRFSEPPERVAALVGYSEVLLQRRYRTKARRYARKAARALKKAKLEGGQLAARVALQLERCAR